MRASLIAPWALLGNTGWASWVPASPALPRDLEPRHQETIPRRAVTNDTSDQWPYGPLRTEGRDIVNSRGDIVTWAGVNWPMSGEFNPPPPLLRKTQNIVC